MKIVYQKKKCAGCGFCAASAPDFFEMNFDGQAELKNSKKQKDGTYVAEITKDDFETLKDIPDFCPVKVIKIIK